MKYHISILLVLLSINAFAQRKTMNLPASVKSDTAKFFKIQRARDTTLQMPDLSTCNDSMHFRFNVDKKYIDIYVRSDNKEFWGIVTKSPYKDTKWVTKGDEMFPIIGSIESMDPHDAKKIFNLFMNNHVFDIPQQDSIKGWIPVESKDVYNIEYSTPTYYSLKVYVAPQQFKHIKEAETIANVMEQAQVLVKNRTREAGTPPNDD